ncbi:MAG: DUF5679 domain-containing protein [Vulcanimicrobiaceae bacterium]
MNPHDATGRPPQGYCVACKAKRDISAATDVLRVGSPAIEGRCAVCGSKIFVLGADQLPEAPPDFT